MNQAVLIILICGVMVVGTFDYVWFNVWVPRSVIVLDTFTQSAYENPGFYNYYCSQPGIRENRSSFCERYPECGDSCLTVKVGEDTRTPLTFKAIKNLGYRVITDQQLTENPEALKYYDKVVVLHNEYVTQAEFEALNAHGNVIYLFPNSLYAKVEYNSTDNSITLIRGHQYPKGVDNGFNWAYENTEEEYNRNCDGWKFRQLPNESLQLNCWPETSQVLTDSKFLEYLKP